MRALSVGEESLSSALSFAISIHFHFDGLEEGMSFEIKQMGRNHGYSRYYSCPKEIYGQIVQKIFKTV